MNGAGSASGLTPAERNKLAGILGLLGSDHAGERDAAALAASRLVRGKGLTWQAVLEGDTAPPRPQAAQEAATGWRADLALCVANLHALSPWEQNFALSVSEKRASLSPGQQAKLAQIATELRTQGFTA